MFIYYDTLAVLASAAWLFLSGVLMYVVVLKRWNDKHFSQISRPSKAFPFWAAIGEKLFQGVALMLLAHWASVPFLPLVAVPLLLLCASYLSTYADYQVSGGPVFLLTLIDGVRIAAALYIVELIIR
ncbi:MAG TPA: hypothetical protein VJ841_02950 [Candidatus Saccharimonadales bacterium]|nr:hypothetical protein [Candidatus Saccharimonadales bacterium]